MKRLTLHEVLEDELFFANDRGHEERHDFPYRCRAPGFANALANRLFRRHYDDTIDPMGRFTCADFLREHVVVRGETEDSPHFESQCSQILIRPESIRVDRVGRNSHGYRIDLLLFDQLLDERVGTKMAIEAGTDLLRVNHIRDEGRGEGDLSRQMALLQKSGCFAGS